MQDQLDTPVFTIWSRKKFAALGCRCSCGRRKYVLLWQDICKRHMGFHTPREIQKRMRCKKCGAPPVDVVLVTYDQLSDWRK
ncbi:hypothetical protein [Thalassospira sp. 11-3]|jgi:hypothetical protein|uniref:hypothetical protein n=1 Tax=Thalassospira sp. 11-3 TaxID=2135614 RepID=UPI000D8A3D7B|nr:hypothetical protein [Thalassospira sp. 11-3]PXX30852.1 hypothetical protein C7967_106112 [Thalassospira sp. 11-3]